MPVGMFAALLLCTIPHRSALRDGLLGQKTSPFWYACACCRLQPQIRRATGIPQGTSLFCGFIIAPATARLSMFIITISPSLSRGIFLTRRGGWQSRPRGVVRMECLLLEIVQCVLVHIPAFYHRLRNGRLKR